MRNQSVIRFVMYIEEYAAVLWHSTHTCVCEDRRGGTLHGLTVTSMCHDTQSGRSPDSLNFIRRAANGCSRKIRLTLYLYLYRIVNASETVLVNAHASSNIVCLRSGNMRYVTYDHVTISLFNLNNIQFISEFLANAV